jgi:hypothetical protein
MCEAKARKDWDGRLHGDITILSGALRAISARVAEAEGDGAGLTWVFPVSRCCAAAVGVGVTHITPK